MDFDEVFRLTVAFERMADALSRIADAMEGKEDTDEARN